MSDLWDALQYLFVGASGYDGDVYGFNVPLPDNGLLAWEEKLMAMLHSIQTPAAHTKDIQPFKQGRGVLLTAMH